MANLRTFLLILTDLDRLCHGWSVVVSKLWPGQYSCDIMSFLALPLSYIYCTYIHISFYVSYVLGLGR